jgi:hypothetical protein
VTPIEVPGFSLVGVGPKLDLPNAFVSATSPVGSLAIAHALMDGASVLIGVLLPLLRA